MKILKKMAENALASAASVIVVSVLNCALGHASTKGECGFKNVKLPCAREWLKLAQEAKPGSFDFQQPFQAGRPSQP